MGRRSQRRPGVRGVYFQTMPFSVNLGGGLEPGSASLRRDDDLILGGTMVEDEEVVAATVA